MNRNRGKTITSLYIFLIGLTFLAVFNVTFFTYYANVSLYVNAFFVIVGLLVYEKISTDDLVFVMVFILYSLLTIFVTDGGLGSVVTVVIPMLMVSLFSNMKISVIHKKVINVICVVVNLILFMTSFSYHAHYRQYLLTHVNPNTLGMFSMFSFMIFCVCSDFKSFKRKILLFVFMGITVWAMYNYESRGTTIATCCFFVLLLLPSKLYSKKKFLALTIILIILGFVFPFIYLYLYRTGFKLELFGKPLYTGRESLWANMFDLMRDNIFKILFGMGSKTSLWDYELNVHNNFFNVVVNFGVVGFVLYYGFIISSICKAANYIGEPEIKKSLCMFICSVVILGFSETTSLWSIIFPFAYWGLINANSRAKERDGLCSELKRSR